MAQAVLLPFRSLPRATGSACRRATPRCLTGRHLGRGFKHAATPRSKPAVPFAFAFDIDGVLVRSSMPIRRAKRSLELLQKNNIPFILLTNGGGKFEHTRVADLSGLLDVQLEEQDFIQSHTPFRLLLDSDGTREGLRDKTILVTGSNGRRVRDVAEFYGFSRVVTPADIYNAHPQIWPFAKPFKDYYSGHARRLPAPIYLGPSQTILPLTDHLKIDAIFVYDDPADWGLDATIILDLLLSHKGYLGTLSGNNGRSELPNRGYQQDSQPELWFSNPDLFWAASWHLNRLGQGGFRAALEGLWRETTGGAELKKNLCGKPTQATYEFAEKRLIAARQRIYGSEVGGLERVYMVGDNPASDIMGANNFKSPTGAKWESILVRTGVYTGGEPATKPSTIVDDIWDAVRWVGQQEGWETP